MKKRRGILSGVLALAGAAALAGGLIATDWQALFSASAAARVSGLDRVRDITAGDPNLQLAQFQPSPAQDLPGGDPATALNTVPVLPVPIPPTRAAAPQTPTPAVNDGVGSKLLALAAQQAALDFIATSLPAGVTIETATPEQLADAISSCGPNADVIAVLLSVRGEPAVIQAVVERAVEASPTLAPAIVGAVAALGPNQAIISTGAAVKVLAGLSDPALAALLIGQVVQAAVAAQPSVALEIAEIAAQAAPGLTASIVAAAVIGNPSAAQQLATIIVPTGGPNQGNLQQDARQLVQSATLTDTQTAALVNVTPSEAQISTTRIP